MNTLPFQKLKIWREAHELTVLIYKVTKSFPREELYSLTCQLRRAASSVPANIAEGSGRRGANEFRHFLDISRASAKEALYFCLLAADLGFLARETADALIKRYEGLSAGIYALISKMKKTA